MDAGDDGFPGGLSAGKHSKITGAPKAAATRNLADLLQKGGLISRETGKATKYYRRSAIQSPSKPEIPMR